MPRTMEVQLEQTGPTTSRARVRSHQVMIDRPVEKDGHDAGPQGGELLLVSLGGCFLSNLLAAAKARSADISNVRVAVTATIGGVPERIEAMTMSVAANHSDRDLMAKLIAIAERGCLVTNTLRNAVALDVVLKD